MNPPFSVARRMSTARVADAALRHIASALARLADGGRLVAITGASLAPDNPAWRDAFVRLQERGRVVFSRAIDGRVYARHGTTIDTRLTVIDRVPADDPTRFPGLARHGARCRRAARLGHRVWFRRGCRCDAPSTAPRPRRRSPLAADRARQRPQRCIAASGATIAEPAASSLPTRPSTGRRPRAAASPTRSMKATRCSRSAFPARSRIRPGSCSRPPWPRSRRRKPVLPAASAAASVADGLLSDAQLESVIYAGEAHAGHLAGSWTVDETFDLVAAAPDDAEDAVRFRRGWFLGDGTGAGKGRQVAGIILDNWLKGRRRALWISKSDKLIEDAAARLVGARPGALLITPLSRFRQGTPIRLDEGILFTTYATLRSQANARTRPRASSRSSTGSARDFDGVIVFDESHAMANAAGGKGERGEQTPSQQGRAGLRLQHALPDARIVYVSATGATDGAEPRLCRSASASGAARIFRSPRAPSSSQAIEAGGVAAMEVLARDLKALGLYAARSLSYRGHRIRARRASAHRRADPHLRRLCRRLPDHSQQSRRGAEGRQHHRRRRGTLNRQAKAAARSAFESAKQRFFNHLHHGDEDARR